MTVTSLSTPPTRRGDAERDVLAFTESAVAFLLELRAFYPGRRLVFLERDMEYHLQVARLLGLADRASSLNVSRSSVRSPLLCRYFEDAGLVGHEPVVLVDSGFNGTVARAVRGALDETDVAIHLLCSFEPTLPSSHYALEVLVGDSALSRADVRRSVETLVERRPHKTRKLEAYERRGAAVRPATVPADPVWRGAAVAFRADVESAYRALEATGAVERHRGMVDDLVSALAPPVDPPVVVHLPPSLVDRVAATSPAGAREFVRDIGRLARSGRVVLAIASPTPGWLAACASFVCSPDDLTAAGKSRWAMICAGEPGDNADDAQKLLAAVVDRLLTEHVRCASAPLVAQVLDRVARRRGGAGLLRDVLVQTEARQVDLVFSDDAVQTLWMWATRPGLGRR